jgi:hypothetical protein
MADTTAPADGTLGEFYREQTLPANTVSVERMGKRITIIVMCDTPERGKNMYEQICADAREGYIMFDLDTKPKPALDGQPLPRERRDD